MAERPAVTVQRMGRDKLALFLPNREAIKAFERLVEDVAATLPDAVLDSATAAEAAQAAADSAKAAADAAHALIGTVLDMDVFALLAMVAELRERVTALTERVNTFDQAPSL